MYGLLALGFYATFAVSSTVNFAQGSSMMLGAVFAYTFSVRLGWPFVPAAAMALILCAAYGLLVELLAVRPFARRGSNAWLMATVALGIVADNSVLFTFGKEPRGLALPWASAATNVLGVHVSALQIAIPVVGLALAAILHWFSRQTKYGKAMLAVVQNADAARLMGINVPLAIMAAYAVSTVFAGAAGIMIAPLSTVHSDMGTVFGLKAFAVAILGGITSAWGVMLAGLVIVALALMPHGLFGRAELKKV
jgi:branched-chain amino acid transport system permease protein